MSRKRSLSLVLIPLVLIAGCTTALAPGAGSVRLYENADYVLGCMDVGEVWGGARLVGNVVEVRGGLSTPTGVKNELKNGAAKKGGNVVVTRGVETAGVYPNTYLTGEGRAFRCDFSRPRSFPEQVAFDEAAYAAYRAPGTGTVTGQAFLKTRGGEVRYAAGDEVYLNPATDYEAARIFKLLRARFVDPTGKPVWTPAPGENWKTPQRTTTADAEGRFKFEGLPPGKYFVSSNVTWDTGQGMTGGWVIQEVTASPGQSVNVIVAATKPPYETLGLRTAEK